MSDFQDDVSGSQASRLTPGAKKVLAAAWRLFYEHGIHAVGVEAIATEAGVTKKTLYDQFGSKDDLVVAYLRARDEQWRGDVRSQLTRSDASVEQRLLSMFDVLQLWVDQGSTGGCAFSRAVAELPRDHPGHEVATAHKRWLLQRLKDVADEADLIDPTLVAEQVFLLHEGAYSAIPERVMEFPVAAAKRAAQAVIREASRA